MIKMSEAQEGLGRQLTDQGYRIKLLEEAVKGLTTRADHAGELLRELAEDIGRMKKDTVKPEVKASTLNLDSIPNRNLLEISERGGVTTLKPVKFLGAEFGEISDAMKALGATYIRDGRNTRWEIGGTTQPSTRRSDKPQIKDPNAPASEKQINFIKRLGGHPKPSITMGEASKIIDNLKAQKGWK